MMLTNQSSKWTTHPTTCSVAIAAQCFRRDAISRTASEATTATKTTKHTCESATGTTRAASAIISATTGSTTTTASTQMTSGRGATKQERSPKGYQTFQAHQKFPPKTAHRELDFGRSANQQNAVDTSFSNAGENESAYTIDLRFGRIEKIRRIDIARTTGIVRLRAEM